MFNILLKKDTMTDKEKKDAAKSKRPDMFDVVM